MPMKKISLTLCLSILFSSLFFLKAIALGPDQIQVRPAQPDDLTQILALDRRVTYEFFKPLYQNHYGQFEFGKNPDRFFEEELKEDARLYPGYIAGQAGQESKRILTAHYGRSCFDRTTLAGFILFHIDHTTVHIDLLLVDKNFRRLGVGRKLVVSVLESFPTATSCVARLLKFGNEATVAFYESLGFVNKGLLPADEISFYGIPYAEYEWEYELTLGNNK